MNPVFQNPKLTRHNAQVVSSIEREQWVTNPVLRGPLTSPSLTAPPPSVAPTLTAADGALLRSQLQPTRQLRQLRILLPLSPTRKTSKRSQSPEELDSKLSLLALGVFELSPFSGDTCLEPPRSVHVLPVAGSLVTGDSFSPKGTLSGLLSLELSGSRWFGSTLPLPLPQSQTIQECLFPTVSLGSE